MTALKALYIIVLIQVSAYILLALYFEHRLQKRNKQYEENTHKTKKRTRQGV